MVSFSKKNRIALGIDISAKKINLALLKGSRGKVKLLEGAVLDVPAGAITGGNISDAAAIAGAIKESKLRDKIKGRPAAISLFAKPALVQVTDLPRHMPGNIAQYISNEVKHCAILPNKNIASDYCGLSSRSQGGTGRVFVAAAENDKLAQITDALNQIGLDVEAIEPRVCAFTRALYEKHIAKRFDSNLLIATLCHDSVNTCVFRNQSLDFIRSAQLDESPTEAEQIAAGLSEQIHAILQYYEMEVSDSSGKWEFIIVLDQSGQVANDVAEALKQKFPDVTIRISTPASTCSDASVVSDSKGEATSLTAVGLAMKLLDVPQSKLKVNLLPARAAERTEAKKHALITANIVGGILIFIMLLAWFLSYKQKKVDEEVLSMRDKQIAETTQVLLEEQDKICNQVDDISAKLEKVHQVLPTGESVKWSQILADIAKSTPKELCITDLSARENERIMIQGVSISYEAVNLFVDMLGKSGFIESADLIGTEKDQAGSGLLSYSLVCSLKSHEGA